MRKEDEPMSSSQYRLASDMTVRPEVLGLQTLLMPFPQNVSAQRGVMWASNSNQAMVTRGNEPPLVMTGWEPQIGEYEYDTTSRKQAIQILEVIPKYYGGSDWAVNSTPTLFVLYKGLDDDKLNYFEINDYTELGEGFGYYNKMMNMTELRQGNVVPKEMKFATSPNHEGEFYAMGRNAKVCRLAHWAANEDAFIISDEFASKMTCDAFETATLDLNPQDLPLNIFGDNETYKITPDIGECVREDGVLIAFRPKNAATFLSDMLPSETQKIEDLHDITYMAKPGAKVVDINVFINREKFNSVVKQDLTGKTVYSQLLKYRDQQMRYYESVVAAVNKYRGDYEMHSELNSLMRQFVGLVASNDAKRNNSTKLMNYKEVIEFIHIEVTYAYELKVALGSKFTGRCGNKGVVGSIWKAENMPVNDFGVRADIIFCPQSVPNRMNPMQLDEQFLNETSWFVRQKMDKLMKSDGWQAAYTYLLEYLYDVRPVWKTEVEISCESDQDRRDLVQECIEHGIYLCVSPYSVFMDEDKIIFLADKYGVVETPVEFNVVRPDGSIDHVRTEETVAIGEEYLLLLGKRPDKMCSAVSCAYNSQFGVPIRPNNKSIKAQNAIKRTPVRLGEHETAILAMSCGADTVMRLTSLYANSPEGVEALCMELLNNPNPSALGHVDMPLYQLIQSNNMVRLFAHQMGIIGYDLSRELKA